MVELDADMNESDITCSSTEEWVGEMCVEGLWCIDQIDGNGTIADLQKQLGESRNCNERLTMERLNLLNAVKDLTLTTNLAPLSEEAQYELAAIPGSSSHDVRFITAGILILYARNSVEIRNLSISGRCSGKLSGNKIDAKKYLKLKNLFCARVRKNAKTLAVGDDRINLFEKLLI